MKEARPQLIDPLSQGMLNISSAFELGPTEPTLVAGPITEAPHSVHTKVISEGIIPEVQDEPSPSYPSVPKLTDAPLLDRNNSPIFEDPKPSILEGPPLVKNLLANYKWIFDYGDWMLEPIKNSQFSASTGINPNSFPHSSLDTSSLGDALESPLEEVDYASDDDDLIHKRFKELAKSLKAKESISTVVAPTTTLVS